MAELSDSYVKNPPGRRSLLEKRLQALAERLPSGQPAAEPHALEAYVLPQGAGLETPAIPRRSGRAHRARRGGCSRRPRSRADCSDAAQSPSSDFR
jgi:hypothetical protein